MFGERLISTVELWVVVVLCQSDRLDCRFGRTSPIYKPESTVRGCRLQRDLTTFGFWSYVGFVVAFWRLARGLRLDPTCLAGFKCLVPRTRLTGVGVAYERATAVKREFLISKSHVVHTLRI